MTKLFDLFHYIFVSSGIQLFILFCLNEIYIFFSIKLVLHHNTISEKMSFNL